MPARPPEGIYDRMRPSRARTKSSSNRPITPAASASMPRRANRARAGGLRFCASLDLKRDLAIQIRHRVRESRHPGRRGMDALPLANHRHHLRASPHSVRTPRRPRMVSREGTLRLLRYPPPGRKGRASVSWITAGDYVAFCPYASRVPFEVWIMPRRHNHLFEAPRPGRKPPPSGQRCSAAACAA